MPLLCPRHHQVDVEEHRELVSKHKTAIKQLADASVAATARAAELDVLRYETATYKRALAEGNCGAERRLKLCRAVLDSAKAEIAAARVDEVGSAAREAALTAEVAALKKDNARLASQVAKDANLLQLHKEMMRQQQQVAASEVLSVYGAG